MDPVAHAGGPGGRAGDHGAGELARCRAEVARAEALVVGAARRLKDACLEAAGALRAAGLTSTTVAKEIHFHDSKVRALASDGDQKGWRPPSLRLAEALDAFIASKLQTSCRLAALRRELDHSQQELAAAKRRLRAASSAADQAQSNWEASGAELAGYLAALARNLGRTQRWLPYPDLDSGFQERAVTVHEAPPDELAAERLASSEQRRRHSEVPWGRAIEGLPIVVVLADAGHGKTWMLRHHARRLCEQALAALRAGADPATVAVPLWMHALDLAQAWEAAPSPADAVVRAATRALREELPAGPLLLGLLGRRLAPDAAPVHVLVDA